VECIKPFAAYQTVKGPIDSTGFYFRCRAEGELHIKGDGAEQPEWIGVKEIKKMLQENPRRFSDVDRAGIMFYLKQK